jgi:succinate dehydrogenase / fumarate reductase cytochrome b subunit
MLRWLGDFLASSIGKKVVLALTGLLLVGFLVEHLYGNLQLFADGQGLAFDGYVAELQSYGWLLTAGEIGLLGLFACHVYLAIRLTVENREARRERYVVRRSQGAATFGSSTMFVTGAILLAYLIKHLLDFRLAAGFLEDPHGHVERKLSSPAHAIVYLLAAAAVGVHLSHGFRSALQTLGANHPRWNPILLRVGWALAILFAAGFAAFPIYYLFVWGGREP